MIAAGMGAIIGVCVGVGVGPKLNASMGTGARPDIGTGVGALVDDSNPLPTIQPHIRLGRCMTLFAKLDLTGSMSCSGVAENHCNHTECSAGRVILSTIQFQCALLLVASQE